MYFISEEQTLMNWGGTYVRSWNHKKGKETPQKQTEEKRGDLKERGVGTHRAFYNAAKKIQYTWEMLKTTTKGFSRYITKWRNNNKRLFRYIINWKKKRLWVSCKKRWISGWMMVRRHYSLFVLYDCLLSKGNKALAGYHCATNRRGELKEGEDKRYFTTVI